MKRLLDYLRSALMVAALAVACISALLSVLAFYAALLGTPLIVIAGVVYGFLRLVGAVS